MKTVVFQGMPGAYSEQAAKKFFTKSYKTIPKKDFRSAFIAVERGDVDFGIIPIENSMAGSIHENYDWLRNTNFYNLDGNHGDYKYIFNPNRVRQFYNHNHVSLWIIPLPCVITVIPFVRSTICWALFVRSRSCHICSSF